MIRTNNHHEHNGNGHSAAPPHGAVPAVVLHRLHTVRCREEVSLRSAARGLGMTEAEVKRQECETADLPVSALRRWAEFLGVPLAELLQDPDESLSLPLLKRARLLRLMKTALAIVEQVRDRRVQRLGQHMVDQLVEIMPELRDVTACHEVGRRRGSDEYGVAYTRRISARVFCDVDDDML